MNPFNGKASIGDRLKTVNPNMIRECLYYLKIKPHPNTLCAQLRHMPVLQQQRGSECGYYMLWNAKCMIRALRAPSSFEQVNSLLGLTNMRKYLSETRRTKRLLLKCTNSYYVNDSDKKELV